MYDLTPEQEQVIHHPLGYQPESWLLQARVKAQPLPTTSNLIHRKPKVNIRGYNN